MSKDPKNGWRPDFARLRGRPYLAFASQIEEAITRAYSHRVTAYRINKKVW